jgi:hypothetical protein
VSQQDLINELSDERDHWKGNHKRQVQLKREANARVRILRDALTELGAAVVAEWNAGTRFLDGGINGPLAKADQALTRTAKRGMPK